MFDGQVNDLEEADNAGTSHGMDDEQLVFKRAKRTVDVLHRARKMEKAIR